MFSGTVFYRGEDGALQVTQVPWDREANFRLPVAVWKEMMEMYFPNTAWLCLQRDAFEQLYNYKVRHGLPTWEPPPQLVNETYIYEGVFTITLF